jgi:anti-anti-sigma regulatory factor
MVADAKAEQAASLRPTAIQAGDVGWVSPPQLDPDSVARLRSQTLQLPLPWVLDWSGVRRVDTEAATHLSTLFRLWAGQDLQMRWIGSERLFAALAEAAPTGVRDADPAFWLARLDALRLVNRADQFDETAIDYCVTYEVSPPSWEPARCSVLLTEPGQPTVAPQLSVLSEVSTSFQDSGIGDAVQVAHVDLSGQLVGDLTDTLNRINASLGSSPVIVVNCANLIRVDFIAAGDLLNWVLSRHHEGRQIQFVDTHRLVALFFGAMGITEHAKVRVRRQ